MILYECLSINYGSAFCIHPASYLILSSSLSLPFSSYVLPQEEKLQQASISSHSRSSWLVDIAQRVQLRLKRLAVQYSDY